MRSVRSTPNTGTVIIVAKTPWVEPIIDRLGTVTTVLVGYATFVTGYVLFLRVSPSLP